MDDTRWFHVRPIFFLACFIALVLLFVPRVIGNRHGVQHFFFFLGCIAIAMGWFFFLKYREVSGIWRSLVFVLTSACLTASLPLFLIGAFQDRHLMLGLHHQLFAAYVRTCMTWGYEGYVPVILGLVGSLFGSGRSRFAFLLASISLLTLRASMGQWVFWMA